MSPEPNLLVTFRPEDGPLAQGEIEARLEELEVAFQYLPSRVDGLFQMRVEGDPKEITKKLRAACEAGPEKFLHTYRWLPVATWTDVDFDDMRSVVREMVPHIGQEERWRIVVNKRFHEEHTTEELVEGVAQVVDRPNVDLMNPEVVIRVEVIDRRAGLVLHRADEVLDVNEVRQQLGLGTM